MKKNKVFYAIAGSNGCGICRSWEDCERCMEYFINARNKKFTDPAEAYSWIEDELTGKAYDTVCMLPDLNVVLKKKLIFFSRQKLPWED